MNRTWWIIGTAGRIVIALFAILVIGIMALPYIASLPMEFVDLPGRDAESRMRAYWSTDVDFRDVEKASAKIYSQIDCHAGWYQITLPPEAAEKWQEAIHTKLEKSSRIEKGTVIEGVHRTAIGPIQVETSLGRPPQWWSPPSFNFRVTERMKWDYSTYADAVYSEFDPSTNTLWIYDYSQQHGKLWSRGAVPSGERFVLPDTKTDQELGANSSN